MTIAERLAAAGLRDSAFWRIWMGSTALPRILAALQVKP